MNKIKKNNFAKSIMHIIIIFALFLSILPSTSQSLPDDCLCPTSKTIPICNNDEKFVCDQNKFPLCKKGYNNRIPDCFAPSSSSSGSSLPKACLCPTSKTIPTCNTDERFVCYRNKFPLCKKGYDNRTPDCFALSSSSGSSLPDACCKNCPDGSKPTCSSSSGNYTYWCLNGFPDCCKNTKVGPSCTSERDPVCFYPNSQISQPKIPLCTEQTKTCPDGNPISCPEGKSFVCINNQPDCCDGSNCTDEFDPTCFYTRSCKGNLSPPGSKCCSACPDNSDPGQLCPPGTDYWCIDGKPSCAILFEDNLYSVPDSNNYLTCLSIQNTNSKCTNPVAEFGCCMLCPSGDIPTCSNGKEYWCINNSPNCCNSNGTDCVGAPLCFSAATYKCSNRNPLPETGCCKSCPNRVDQPQCPTSTNLWCINGITTCCTFKNESLYCLSAPPKCLKANTRQCF